MKRGFDILFSLLILIVSLPLLLPVLLAVWLQDFHSPFYLAPRVGLHGRIFRMVKVRSMVVDADKSGVDSTEKGDRRITWIGHFVRRFKIDELGQFWNVLVGDMSVVGPRPNVQRQVSSYTAVERKLLDLRPGITDIASIVFSDEGEILADSEDPDLKYNQVIRPWKSRLGLLYVRNVRFVLDLKLIGATALALVSRRRALVAVQRILNDLGTDEQLKRVAIRTDVLMPFPPPGADAVVTQC